METNIVYQEDCIEGMKKIPDNSIDLIIADPPYYEIIEQNWDSFKTFKEYIEFVESFLDECIRVLKEKGSLYIWGMLGFKDKTFTIFRYISYLNKKLIFQNFITWERNASRHTTKNWTYTNEHLLFYTKSEDYYFKPQFSTNKRDAGGGRQLKDIKKYGEYKYCTNVWSDLGKLINTSNEKTQHPTQKPISICKRIIQASSREGELILIPFAGSGSECIASVELNRKYIGFETNPQYIKIINKRLAQSTVSDFTSKSKILTFSKAERDLICVKEENQK